MSAAFDPHPAPHRHLAGPGVLLIGLMAGPAAWIAQLVAAYGLSSYVCAPAGMPRLDRPAVWSFDRPALLGFNILCLLLAIVGGVIAARSWRRTRGEKPGGGHRLMEVGEGRTRFLAACGLMSAIGFGLAILFNTVEFFTIPACWGTGS